MDIVFRLNGEQTMPGNFLNGLNQMPNTFEIRKGNTAIRGVLNGFQYDVEKGAYTLGGFLQRGHTFHIPHNELPAFLSNDLRIRFQEEDIAEIFGQAENEPEGQLVVQLPLPLPAPQGGKLRTRRKKRGTRKTHRRNGSNRRNRRKTYRH
jgi:hypothetical protein